MNSSSRRAFRPSAVALEDRNLPSTFTVTNLFDSGPGSLRDQVQLANLTPGNDVVNFLPGLNGTINLASGEIAVSPSTTTDTVDITALANGNNITIDAHGSSRIFDVKNTDATIEGLTLENGFANNYWAAFVNNDWAGAGGGDGGAIQQLGGTLRLNNDNFVGNFAYVRGGAVFNYYGNLVLNTNNTFVNNSAVNHGGAIYNSGTMTASGLNTFTGNSAGESGGAIENVESIIGFPSPISATITGSTFTANTATNGGAVANQNGASIALSSDTFMANVAARGGAFYLAANAGPPAATIASSLFLANTGTVAGGAVFSDANLTISGSTLRSNASPDGGAIHAKLGTLTLLGVNTIDHNTSFQVIAPPVVVQA